MFSNLSPWLEYSPYVREEPERESSSPTCQRAPRQRRPRGANPEGSAAPPTVSSTQSLLREEADAPASAETSTAPSHSSSRAHSSHGALGPATIPRPPQRAVVTDAGATAACPSPAPGSKAESAARPVASAQLQRHERLQTPAQKCRPQPLELMASTTTGATAAVPAPAEKPPQLEQVAHGHGGGTGRRQSSRPRSKDRSPDSGDDDFVFVLHDVLSTKEAIEKIRSVQNGQAVRGATTLSGAGGDSCGHRGKAHAGHRSELPETMNDFYECPNYIVSLVVARQAIFEDALSGFHSLVLREEAEAEAFRLKKAQAALHRRSRERAKAAEAARQQGTEKRKRQPQKTEKRPSPSPVPNPTPQRGSEKAGGARAEPSANVCAKSPPTAPPSVPSSSSPSSPPHDEPSSAPGPEEGSSGATRVSLSSSAAADSPGARSSRDASATSSTAAAGPTKTADDKDVPASLMFLWRSRDEAALRAMTPANADAIRAGLSRNPSHVAGDEAQEPARANGTAAPPPLAAPSPSPPPTQETDRPDTHPPQVEGEEERRAGGEPRAVASVRSAVEAAAEEEKQREKQYLIFLREKELARRRAPQMFRYVYPPRLDFIKLGGDTLKDPHDIRHIQHQANHNSENRLVKEWLYVWEQFERDIHREVLLIEDASYTQPEEAVAAILSFVEYAFDRGRAAALERLNKPAAVDRCGSPTDSAKPSPPGQQPRAASAPDTERKPEKKGFFESISAAFRDVTIKAHDTLPAFMADPLISASGLDAEAVRAATAYPADPVQRGRKIFNAVREVVLSSQQSFMGFPYQLLCEQVGTERLALALEEYMEEEQETLRQHQELVLAANAPSEKDLPWSLTDGESAPIQTSSPLALPSAAIPVGSFNDPCDSISLANSLPPRTPLSRSANVNPLVDQGSSLRNGNMSPRRETSSRFDKLVSTPASPLMPAAAPVSSSRVLRIYHGGGEKDSERPDGGTPPPPTDSAFAAASPDTAAPPPSCVLPQAKETSGGKPCVDGRHGCDATAPVRHERPSSSAPPRASPDRSGGDAAAAALRRLEEQRRAREKKLPLLVGEPRPAEFQAFLDIIRATVEAKNARDDASARRRHAQKVDREKQSEKQHPIPPVARPASASKAGDAAGKATANATWASITTSTNDRHRRHGLFRSDVDGSAYLLPVPTPRQPQPSPTTLGDDEVNGADAREGSSLILNASASGTFSRNLQGMRVLLYFNPRRNAPVVCVNKVFRLFTVPGLRSFAHPAGSGNTTRHGSEDDLLATTDGTEDDEGKSLLLLIQIEFSLFTQEEAEVRWRWYTVAT